MSERVEYVIGTGPPSATLFSCVREPGAFLTDASLRLNLPYYLKGTQPSAPSCCSPGLGTRRPAAATEAGGVAGGLGY